MVSGRDLLQPPARDIKPTAPLVLADPDFDLAVAEADQRGRAQRNEERPAEVSLAGRKGSGMLSQWPIQFKFQPDGAFVVRAHNEHGEVYGKVTGT